eukprot:2544727-Amphidinium_carterae.1
MQAEKGDGRGAKRARTDISSLEEQLRNLLQVQGLTGNSSNVPSVSGLTISSLEVMSMGSKGNSISLGLDSGAEVT